MCLFIILRFQFFLHTTLVGWGEEDLLSRVLKVSGFPEQMCAGPDLDLDLGSVVNGVTQVSTIIFGNAAEAEFTPLRRQNFFLLPPLSPPQYF